MRTGTGNGTVRNRGGRTSPRGYRLTATNGKAALVRACHAGYDIRVAPMRRDDSARGCGRTGEDVVIHVPRQA